MKIAVSTADAGRIDKVLARHLPGVGRRRLAVLFDAGAVVVGGTKAKKGDRVTEGQVIELEHIPATGDALRPQPDPTVALHILLERPDLVAVAKPAGIPSQPLRVGELGTVANAIATRFPECAWDGTGDSVRDGGLVHRLDIGTSGVLLVARTADAYRALREAFRSGRVAKTYLALVDHRPVSRECDAPLSQRGDHVAVDYTNGLFAHTEFSVERSSGTHALVRCSAHTGRMHQVRAHLAHVGAPIAGDIRYGGNPVADHPGFFLHAAALTVEWNNQTLTVSAPTPERFALALAAVGIPEFVLES